MIQVIEGIWALVFSMKARRLMVARGYGSNQRLISETEVICRRRLLKLIVLEEKGVVRLTEVEAELGWVGGGGRKREGEQFVKL